jgi:hypothetical protein
MAAEDLVRSHPFAFKKDSTLGPASITTATSLAVQLKDASGYSDPSLMVIVRDGMKKVVLPIPFLAACA